MKMKKYVVLMMVVLTLSLASLAGAAIGTVHDLNTDMKGTAYQAGNWAYGWSTDLGTDPGDFGFLDYYVEARPAPDLVHLWVASVDHGGPHLWYVVAGGNFFGANAGEHGFCPPGGTVDAQYTTFRWTAPADVAAAVDITGWARPANVTQVKKVVVAKNGTELFSAVVMDTLVDFTGMSEVAIAAGDVIDIAIHRYDDSDSSGWDWCGVSATITEVPEPMTIGLLSLGGLALLRRRR